MGSSVRGSGQHEFRYHTFLSHVHNISWYFGTLDPSGFLFAFPTPPLLDRRAGDIWPYQVETPMTRARGATILTRYDPL